MDVEGKGSKCVSCDGGSIFHGPHTRGPIGNVDPPYGPNLAIYIIKVPKDSV